LAYANSTAFYVSKNILDYEPRIYTLLSIDVKNINLQIKKHQKFVCKDKD